MKYRKKPIVIEAIKVGNKRKDLDSLQKFMGKILCGCTVKVKDNILECVQIDTLEGIMTAIPGDYIIKGIRGEFYPCKPNIFEQTYEKVEDGVPS
jgi:hypothetical protein